MKPITILLAEDHTIVREGFRRMLELEDDFEIIAEAADGRQAVALAKKFRPDVLLMDIAMPLLNGLEATRQVMKALPTARVLMLSAHNDYAYVDNAIQAGAMGFLLKQTSAHEVCRAIREVFAGKSFFSPTITKRLAQQKLSARPNPASPPPNLPRARWKCCNSSPRARPTSRPRPNWASASRPSRSTANISCRSSTSMTPPASRVTPSARASSRAACS